MLKNISLLVIFLMNFILEGRKDIGGIGCYFFLDGLKVVYNKEFLIEGNSKNGECWQRILECMFKKVEEMIVEFQCWQIECVWKSEGIGSQVKILFVRFLGNKDYILGFMV